MQFGRKDIEQIAEENVMKIDFLRWKTYEMRQIVYGNEDISEHIDILTTLKHLEYLYDTGLKRGLTIKHSIDHLISVAHNQAHKEDRENKSHRGFLEDWEAAWDIFYLLRDSRAYLEDPNTKRWWV